MEVNDLFNGQQFSMFIVLALTVTVLMMVQRARSGLKIPKIRRLAGLDAIDEAIGRATEMGRSVIYFPGRGALNNAQTLAAFAVLGYVGRSCARYDTKLIACSYAAPVYSVMEGIVRDSFLSSGKEDRYDQTIVRSMGSGWGATSSSSQGVIRREKAAACLYIGAWYADTMMLADAGALLGAIQVGGTAEIAEIPYIVAACDYALIGEEIFAAGAYLSEDSAPKANLVALDYFKIAAVLLLCLGVLLETVGTSWFTGFTTR